MSMSKSMRPACFLMMRLLACAVALMLVASCAARKEGPAWEEPEKPTAEAPPQEQPAVQQPETPAAPGEAPVQTPPEEAEAQPAIPQQAEESQNYKDFTFRNVRQYFVMNDQEGRILAVEGFAVNHSTAPKDFITVEASLFDDVGTKIASKRSVAGVTVPVSQLETFSSENLESLLHDEVGIFMTNVNIAPGGEVPFMVLFYNPPDGVSEFGVKVVDAQDTEADQGEPSQPADDGDPMQPAATGMPGASSPVVQ